MCKKQQKAAMDKLLTEEKETRQEDEKHSSVEKKKKASVTAIEGRLSALQKIRANGSSNRPPAGGGSRLGEPMSITQFCPTKKDGKKQ